MPSPGPDRVAVARVLAPHGIRGEVRAEVLSDDPQRLSSVQECWLRLPRGGSRPARISGVRPGPGGTAIVAFDGIGDRRAAEGLRGALVEVPADRCPPLPEGRFYLFELDGMEVVDEQGRHLGRVSGVLRSRAHDIWEVTRPAGRPLLIPAVRAFVVKVDRGARRVVVRLPQGLEP